MQIIKSKWKREVDTQKEYNTPKVFYKKYYYRIEIKIWIKITYVGGYNRQHTVHTVNM